MIYRTLLIYVTSFAVILCSLISLAAADKSSSSQVTNIEIDEIPNQILTDGYDRFYFNTNNYIYIISEQIEHKILLEPALGFDITKVLFSVNWGGQIAVLLQQKCKTNGTRQCKEKNYIDVLSCRINTSCKRLKRYTANKLSALAITIGLDGSFGYGINENGKNQWYCNSKSCSLQHVLSYQQSNRKWQQPPIALPICNNISRQSIGQLANLSFLVTRNVLKSNVKPVKARVYVGWMH